MVKIKSHLENFSKRAWLSLIAIIFGVAGSLALLDMFFVPDETNFEAASTLGAATTDTFGTADGFLVHCLGSRDSERCLDGQRRRAPLAAALWLGNSQVHAVNQLQSGETNASPLLFRSLKKKGIDLLTFSLPNANLQEHYVLFEYLRLRMPLKILILPVCFDDLREEGLRSPDVTDFLKDSETKKSLSETLIGRRLLKSAESGKTIEVGGTNDDTEGIADSIQERVEKNLNGWLGEHSRLWQLRPEIRGWLFYRVLYPVRNTVLGITPSTTRRLIPGRYRDNFSAIEAILARATTADVSVIVYVVPLRGGVQIPYDVAEYAAFKSDLELMALKNGAIFENLEHLVPDDSWGTKGSTSLKGSKEIDFMHFAYPGHRLLAEALDSLVTAAMRNKD
jgi:hypothetical protein